jgi:ubiquinone biosynthesis protein UbiJ
MSDPSIEMLQAMLKDVLYMLANQAVEIREIKLDIEHLSERLERLEQQLELRDG